MAFGICFYMFPITKNDEANDNVQRTCTHNDDDKYMCDGVDDNYNDRNFNTQ